MSEHPQYTAVAALLDFHTFHNAFQKEIELVNSQGVHSFGVVKSSLEIQWRRWADELTIELTIEQSLGSLCFYLCGANTVVTTTISDQGIQDLYTRTLHELILDCRVQYFAISFCVRRYRLAAIERTTKLLLAYPKGMLLQLLERLCPLYVETPSKAREVIFEFWPWLREYESLNNLITEAERNLPDDYHGA